MVVFGTLGGFGALALLVLFGGLAGFMEMFAHSEPDTWFVAPLLGIIGMMLFLLLLIVSMPSIVAGMGLLSFRPWARILAIVLSALVLLHFPLGTLPGFYGLWVLFSRETELLFMPSASR